MKAETLPAAPHASLTMVDAGRSPDGASRYRIGRLIGCGGMGEVHACEDVSIGRDIAIKTLRFGAEGGSALAEPFLREARLQARLEHPAIVPVYEIGTTADGAPFFTMKRVRGTTLAQVLAVGTSTGAAWSLRKLLTAFTHVCLAVDYAHRRGVVHCDLKPGNIMLGPFGEVHLLDWGCARSVPWVDCDVDAETLLRFDSPLSSELAVAHADGVAGTLGYMAPEQLSGAAVDIGADVYALGAILFEILTREPLHRGTTPLALMKSTLQGVESRPSLRCADSSIAPTLDQLVASAVATDPLDRPATARELAEKVEAYLDHELQVARERESADHHARAAQRAADEAIQDGRGTARAEALREAARALAFEPGNETAGKILAAMLVRPPSITPPDAKRQLDEVDRADARDALRALGMRAAVWASVVPLALSLGVRSAAGAGLAVGSVALFGGVVLAARLLGLTGRGWQLAILGAGSFAVATFAGLFGPFVVVPALSATLATAFAMFHGSHDRLVAICLGVGAVLVPLGLEVLGLLPESSHVTLEGIVLLPRIVWFSPGTTLFLLIVANVLAIPVNVLIAGRLRDALDEARRKLALHAWQLERTLPAMGRQ
jgi:hypothetical protein